MSYIESAIKINNSNSANNIKNYRNKRSNSLKSGLLIYIMFFIYLAINKFPNHKMFSMALILYYLGIIFFIFMFFFYYKKPYLFQKCQKYFMFLQIVLLSVIIGILIHNYLQLDVVFFHTSYQNNIIYLKKKSYQNNKIGFFEIFFGIVYFYLLYKMIQFRWLVLLLLSVLIIAITVYKHIQIIIKSTNNFLIAPYRVLFNDILNDVYGKNQYVINKNYLHIYLNLQPAWKTHKIKSNYLTKHFKYDPKIQKHEKLHLLTKYKLKKNLQNIVNGLKNEQIWFSSVNLGPFNIPINEKNTFYFNALLQTVDNDNPMKELYKQKLRKRIIKAIEKRQIVI